MKINTDKKIAALSAVSQHKHPPTLININALSDAPYMNPSTGVFVEQILLLTQRAEKHSFLAQTRNA
jgi:hypothetical protein